VAKILLPIFLALICGCVSAQTTQPAKPDYHIGHIDDPAIPESSGIVESRKHAGVYWTQNDSGNPPMVFAIDRTGKTIGRFHIDAKNVDWEDIADDDAGHLYLSDMGNNNLHRKQVQVYQIDEPDPHAKDAAPLTVTQTWQLTYPDKPFDCESLFIWKDHGYVISKYRWGDAAGLYRFSLAKQDKPAVLEKLFDLPIHVACTGADISHDGKQIAVITICGPYLFDLPTPGDVASMEHATVRSIFYADVHMEAVCFTAEGLLTTSESRPMCLFRWKDFERR
jgi:hypothetical protein